MNETEEKGAVQCCHPAHGARGTRFTQRGQASLAAALSILLLVLLAAGSVDLVRLWVTRAWAYRAAEAAALAGVAQGRDYEAYVATGAVALHPEAARSATESALRQALQARGVAPAAYDIRVHPTDLPATYSGYPPVTHAGMFAGDWTPTQPGVAVYLEVPVQPVLYGWVNGNAPVLLHVFAAAEVVTAT